MDRMGWLALRRRQWPLRLASVVVPALNGRSIVGGKRRRHRHVFYVSWRRLTHCPWLTFHLTLHRVSLAIIGPRVASGYPIPHTVALRARSIVKGATLRVHSGSPHGMCATHKGQIDADLLAFLRE
jgi:hypothetical protein